MTSPEPGAVEGPVMVPRERRILDAAEIAFHEKGFHGVGVDEIGRRAGFSGPALYRHFAGKDQILATLLNEAMDELMGALAAIDGPPDAELERVLRHHIEFAIERRQLVGIYQRESRNLAEPLRSAFARRTRDYTQAWEALVAANFPNTPAAQVAAGTQAALGLIFSVWVWPDRALRAGNLEDLLHRIVRSGLNALQT